MKGTAPRRSVLRAFLLALALVFGMSATGMGVAVVLFGGPAQAQRAVEQPRNTAGPNSADQWHAIREGAVGTVAIPDKKEAVLIQPGQDFREWHNGPLTIWGAIVEIGMIAVLAIYFVARGRIRIHHGWSGRVVTRFNDFERFVHWLVAGSFVVLGVTGLNMLYGRYVIRPIIGASLFSWETQIGKWLHNYLSFAFMVGIVLMFVMWVGDNFPTRADWLWLARGGGMFTKLDSEPPAWKFNAGQKILFWLVILGGVSVTLSGLALLFPFTFHWFSATFAVLNVFGFHLPTNLTPLAETQLSQLWHAAVGLMFIALIVAHIYLGTLGMEGAFDAMASGQVDANWAKQHHSLWAAALDERSPGSDD
ncbi:MAG: formate dehydrogenase subunit gamma [Alphaproteobacteria bacterium]|nr:formate dehydrogenase subunit gamma [Alphaproteobacteria bacterium]